MRPHGWQSWMSDLVVRALESCRGAHDRGVLYLGHGLEARRVAEFDPEGAATMADACWVPVRPAPVGPFAAAAPPAAWE